jgi:hypothetical protein
MWLAGLVDATRLCRVGIQADFDSAILHLTSSYSPVDHDHQARLVARSLILNLLMVTIHSRMRTVQRFGTIPPPDMRQSVRLSYHLVLPQCFRGRDPWLVPLAKSVPFLREG